MKKPIFVTQPFLPPLGEFNEYLQKIWDSKIITNNGPFHQQLEKALCEYLGVPFISLFANGTLALITALQALDIKGEVITTPFSFIATAHSLLWNGITPVFADVDPVYGNIDPQKIQAAITNKTSALLPVHVYGNPCDHKMIETIAQKNNIKLIYDAAHCFGVRQNGVSVCNYGDLSILSFHATKVFNTFEGGAIVCHTPEIKQHIDDLKNFGFRDEVTVVAPGINAKMNEMQAAMGLLQLKYSDTTIEKRRRIAEFYRENLVDIKGIRVLKDIENVKHNYSYFPVFIDEEVYGLSRDLLYEKLKQNNVFGRRYFYPLISTFKPYRNLPSSASENLAVAKKLAGEVICLPIYNDLEISEAINICNCIKMN